MPTLDEFMRDPMFGLCEDIREPGWKMLYLRKEWHRFRLDGVPEKVRCVVLMDIEAEEPGRGLFTRLIERLRREYPTWSIYVEDVLSDRFRDGLQERGWGQDTHTYQDEFSYYLLAADRSEWAWETPYESTV